MLEQGVCLLRASVQEVPWDEPVEQAGALQPPAFPHLPLPPAPAAQVAARKLVEKMKLKKMFESSFC